MKKIWLSILFVISASFLSVSGQSAAVRSDLARAFKDFSLARLDSRSVARSAGTTQTFGLSFGGREIELRLTPRELRAARYVAEDTWIAGTRILPQTAITTYRGSIAGDPGSSLRLTIDDSKIEGYFVTGGETYFIEPATNYSKSAASDEFVVYRRGDVLLDDSFSCGSELIEKIERGKQMVGSSSVVTPLRVVEIGTEADYDFVQSATDAAGANAKILSILNMVEGLYETELGLTLSVVLQHTYSTPDALDGSNEVALLNSFRNDWETRYPTSAFPRDTSHLFTYKPNVRARGYAFIGEVCQSGPNYAYGLSGRMFLDWNWESANFFMTAHEIAHNVGANHNQTVAGCENALMRAPIDGNTQFTFCSSSRSEVAGYVAANGTCLTPAPTAATPFDYDGDSKTDTAIFRPSNGTWFIANSASGGFSIFQFGQNGDRPVGGDFDGDGKADPAVFRAGVWWRMKSSNNTFDAVSFGLATDAPAAGDFDGDGKTDVAVFRPSTGVWHRLLSGDGSYSPYQFGINGDLPMPGDFDGDGKADLSVFRPSNGVWYRINSSNGSSFAVQFGQTGDTPVGGDFDGDGKADPAVFRASTGTWFALRSSDGGYIAIGFGLVADVPVPGDYDGDGRTDIAVWRPSTGVWHRLNSSSGGYLAYQFGLSSDVAVPGR